MITFPYQLTRKNNPLYSTWKNMRDRCNNPNNPKYKNYGGRGIFVCEEWDNFLIFSQDMGPKPTKTSQLDRINNNAGYFKDNCEWIEKTENLKKKGLYTTKYDLPKGVTLSPCKSKYISQFKKDNIKYYLGTFITPKEAHLAYIIKLSEIIHNKGATQ